MLENSCQLSVASGKKKNFLRLCGFFVLCAFAVAGCAKREIRNLNSQGKNIICFGDSITFGYGANPGEDYPAVLARMTDIPVINSGIDGDTSIEALKRIDSDILDRNSLLVIIEFGGNDFLRKIPRDVTINNIREMIDKIQAKGAMVAIADISAGILLKEYHAAFFNLAKEKEAIFIPRILSGIITNPKLKSDFIHPNAEGYKTVAQKVFCVISPYLQQNIILRKINAK